VKMYRAGIIGFAHMHVNNVAAHYAAHPQIEWVACADTTPYRPELRRAGSPAPYTREWNMRHALDDLGVPKGYDDYHEMLNKETFDLIIVQSENAQHADIVEACAAHGVHACVEKPMADTLSHALRMVRACQAAGTTLIINWPLTWSPAARKAKSLLDGGIIGRILQLKWRAGHTGPLGSGAAHAGVDEVAAPMSGPERGATWWHQIDTGGGAMLDFCCYGAMVARWMIGEQATAAIGMRANLDSRWGEADDNAAMLVRFPEAMALFEGSWTTWDHGVPTGPILYGTTGTLVVERHGGAERIRVERGGGRTETYEPEPLPEGRDGIAAEIIHHLETGEPLHPTLEMLFNLEAMAILDAGVRSAESRRLEIVDNATWCIG
jgi:predicted dehydrogenase